MKKHIYLIVLLIILPFSVKSAMWQPRIINYEHYQYKAGFQNWMVTQSEDGWMYFANSNGLLEFDGINWAIYPVPNKVLRSVKVIDGRVYVGGSSEFGYFESNKNGFLSYKSLKNKTLDWAGEVWNIMVDDNNVYFVSDNYIHITDKQTNILKTITSDVKIECSTIIKHKLYIGSTQGIFYLNEADSLKLLATSSKLINHKLISILPYENNILVTTAHSGLYMINEIGLQKITSIADQFIGQNQLFSTSVDKSKIALGSVQNGIFIFDLKNPSYKETFNLTNGLKNNTVLSSFFDTNKNLWLGLDKGVSYIDLNSTTRPLFAIISPIGTGYCSKKFQNKLYLGTNQGLYTLNNNNDPQLIKGSEGQIWSMTIIDEKLFCSGDNGIMVITPNETYKINIPGAWETQPVKANKDKLIVGTYSGFAILEKKNGKWFFLHKIPDFYDSARGVIEDDINNTFWVANQNKYIQRISFDHDFTTIKIKEYHLDSANIDGNAIFRKIDNNIVVCAKNGIYKYSRISDSFDHYHQLEAKLDGAKYYEYLYNDKLNNIWFISSNNLKILPYSGGEYKAKIQNIGLANELITNYQQVNLIDSTTAIIAVENAFVKTDLAKKRDQVSKVNIFIRQLVSSKNDSIICYGNAQITPELPYSLNSIKIHFAATNFTELSRTLYSYRLKEIDNQWSTPYLDNTKEYTNLSEGEYVFEVKAIVDGEYESTNVAEFKFVIRPPWYRSTIAYILYTLTTIIFLFLSYKKTIDKQRKIIVQKGEEIVAQTKRYEEETKMKDQEIYELQNENLRNELRHKTHELSGYALNMIRKNEILDDVKKKVIDISKAIDENKQQSAVKQKVVRLIGQINSNIEHDNDFEIFKSNFDLVHKDFFRLLDRKFPGLTRNDKILCAYLNMNIPSKEIAPLLNISVRGVEVNRYRLRKKMNLDRDINLAEYLQALK